MVHVSINDSIKDLRFEDNSLIRVQNANIVDISDWGDEDVVKEVTTCDECVFKIDKSIIQFLIIINVIYCRIVLTIPDIKNFLFKWHAESQKNGYLIAVIDNQ